MMNRIIFLLAAVFLWGCGKPASPVVREGSPERIISLAPNITEILYVLGLGDKLVGNTPHCTYPEAARALPKVGGFGQFSYESIVLLRPDLVILHQEDEVEKARLKSLGIPTLETGSYFISDILEAIDCIGTACDAKEPAEELMSQLKAQMGEMAATEPSLSTPRPRVLITFGSMGEGPIQAFGTQCIHNELLEIAGGKNVIEGNLPFVTLSREALLRLNPDIIMVLAPELGNTVTPSNEWDKYPTLRAVKNNQVHLLTADYTCIPGPRFIKTLNEFSRIIRPHHPSNIILPK